MKLCKLTYMKSVGTGVRRCVIRGNNGEIVMVSKHGAEPRVYGMVGGELL